MGQTSSQQSGGRAANRGCPMEAAKDEDGINPLNNMDRSLQGSVDGKVLPTDRMTSSIPRGEKGMEDPKGKRWVYPSQQMFYNAMKKKNWNPRQEDMASVVAIHNAVNERTWQHILIWEHMRNPQLGILSGPSESPDFEKAKNTHRDTSAANDSAAGDQTRACSQIPSLIRFVGKPDELSPRARVWTLLGYTAPFDRHDWTIRRPDTNEEVRYIIDYYSATPAPGSPAGFFLDVRPALDRPGAVAERAFMFMRRNFTSPGKASA
eukprot:Clim_evm22s161 gene=Clim_evmTU22s161